MVLTEEMDFGMEKSMYKRIACLTLRKYIVFIFFDFKAYSKFHADSTME